MAAAVIPAVDVAWATEGDEAQDSAGEIETVGAGQDLSALSRDELLAMLKDAPVATGDLVLPDGTVIDKAHVTLRTRLNRIGDGFGGTPGVHGYDFFTSLWTVEEAQAECEMPLLQWFTAYDFSLASGRSVEEATSLCESLAEKRLICHADRGGTDW